MAAAARPGWRPRSPIGSPARGWFTGFRTDTATDAEEDWLARVVSPLLVVIDYVEALPTARLVRLLRVLTARPAATVALFTARSRGPWWVSLNNALDRAQVAHNELDELGPLAQHPQPLRLFNRAYRRFAALPDAGSQLDPDPPADTGHWTPLELLMLAWLAAHVGPDLPGRRTTLYDKIIGRELEHWRDAIGTAAAAAPTTRTLHTAACAVALLNPTNERLGEILTATNLLAGTGDAPVRVAEQLSALLREQGTTTLAVRPDPLADHLVRTAFTANPRLYRAYLDAIDLQPTPSADGTPQPPGSVEAERFCANLTRAAEGNDPHDRATARQLAETALQSRPQLWAPAFEVALLRGGAFVPALEKLAAHPDTPLAMHEIMRVPVGHADLAGLALTAAQRTAPPDPDPDAPPTQVAATADALTMLAIRQAGTGHHRQAHTTARRVTELYRQLAQANPGAYLPDLAMSLNNLGAMLSELGRRDDALAPTQEAVTIRRQLAQANPGAYLPDLAMSLNNLGAMLSELGRRDDALATTQEAVTIYRQLAQANPGAYLPDLAMSLNNLGIRLSELGRRDDVAAAFAEVWRTLSPGPRGQLRARLARWHADRPGVAATGPAEPADFAVAIADADAEPAPELAARARRAVRSAAWDVESHRGLTEGPPWLTADLPDDVVAPLNHLLAAGSWTARGELLRQPDAQTLWLQPGQTARTALAALYADNPALLDILSTLDDIADRGLDQVLDDVCTAEAHQTLLADWLNTPTWTASRRFHTTHPDLVTDPRTETLLAGASGEPIVRQHLAIVRLHAAGMSLDEVYDLILDATDAADAALVAIDQFEISRLVEVWYAAPHLARQPFLAPYLAAVISADSGDADQAAVLIRTAATQADQHTPCRGRHTTTPSGRPNRRPDGGSCSQRPRRPA